MAALSSIFWVLGFTLSVVMAPQLRIWTWGPTMSCFALSVLFALPSIKRMRFGKADTFIVISGAVLVTWIGIRAFLSPVAELAQSDLLLTAMAVATFASFHASSESSAANRILLYGIASLLAASIYVVAMQIGDRTFSPVFPNRDQGLPSGFFAHYSYGASLLVPASLLAAAMALHSKEHWLPRILLGLIALLGAVAVYFTKSRGGFIGIAAGSVCLVVLSTIVYCRNRAKSFSVAVLLLPIILIGLAVLSLDLLGDIQARRSGSGELDGMLDNTIRFYMMGIAISCFWLHPLIGGGSRSYSWECFRFWDTEAMGRGSGKPEHVHNELLQTATDYGAIGAGLLVFFILCMVIVAIMKILPQRGMTPGNFSSPWRIGGLAGFVGLFAQSNFEGIFRIPPGAIVLALCISAACIRTAASREQPKATTNWLPVSLMMVLGLACSSLLLFYGVKGSRASTKLWSAYFAPVAPGLEARADALSEAIAIWPLGSLYHQRGIIYQSLAAKSPDREVRQDFLKLSITDYKRAGELHPFSPEPPVNSATLLSALGNDDQAAELQFRRAVKLQGGMEAAFHANRLFADHLRRKGLREFSEGNILAALTSLQLAVTKIDRAAELRGGRMGSLHDRLRVDIHESYGRVLEEMDDFAGAMEVYDKTATLHAGTSAHYRAGILLGKLAVNAWSERKSEDAMALFLMALERTNQSRDLPTGVTRERRHEYTSYLKKTIKYLQGAKIQPSENPPF